MAGPFSGNEDESKKRGWHISWPMAGRFGAAQVCFWFLFFRRRSRASCGPLLQLHGIDAKFRF